MSIIEDTSIDQSTFECDDQFLNFPPFEKIGNGTLNTHFLTDVVGQVSSLRDVQTVQVAGNDKKKVEFRLMDIKGESIACCLWGKYAEQLEEHLQQTNNPNMVCLIRFAKIGFYRGDMQITNAFDSSLICFDPDLPELCQMMSLLLLTATKNDKRPIKDLIDDWNDVGIISISEIITATQEEDCKIICSIESIDTDWSWFIFGHVSRNRCNKRCMRIKSKGGGNLAPNEKPIFWCTTCRVNTTTVTPQFKLHLTVKDDTSTCKLMLLDSVAKVVVGFEAKDIWDGSYEETSFLVSQVWSGDKILQLESNSEPITHASSGSSIMSGGEDVVYIPTDAAPPSNQQKLQTPCVDSGTGQASHGSLQRSQITSLPYTSGIRKRPRSSLPHNSHKKSFISRLDEELACDTVHTSQMSGDESEDNGNSVATESDFEGYILA
ncbi:hypothetical protein DY000_02034498 [Brassica cretica]|uniref:Replication protein A OB domain-containing protein n=1 Tax=Brassica cretica TaxID=69181 RepID=A0ABQ7DGQ5_BRACR|nr:hypothetical protein DY000_02034498 [Brassica cretica]